MECFRCGISEFKVNLYDVISPKGIEKVCRPCSEEINLPVIKKNSESQFRESMEKSTVKDRLIKLSGHRGEEYKKPEILEKQESELKEVMKENLAETIKSTRISADEFIDNFQWVIMRQRRIKKLTQKELAYEIRESEAAIKLAEQGIVSNQTPLLIEKLEKFLHAHLRKNSDYLEEELYPMRKKVESLNQEEDMSFDPMKTIEVTIGDLKAMKHEKEERVMNTISPIRSVGSGSEEPNNLKVTSGPEGKGISEHNISVEIKEPKDSNTLEGIKEKPLDEQDLSKSEMDDILFGKKE